MTAATPDAGAAAGSDGQARGGRSLRFRVNAIVAALMSVFVLALLALQILATRHSVHEEIVAANRVAGQLLQRVGWVYSTSGPAGIRGFLAQLGRLRANDITLVDDAGTVLFRSPPSTYKQGRSAPQWFTDLVQPPMQHQQIQLAGGRLSVQADPSRAILDGWDDLLALSAVAAVVLVVINVLVFWLVGAALRPLPTIVQGLQRLQDGDYSARLPPLPGREAATIGEAVNQLAAAVERHVQERLRAFETERSLRESRELVSQIEQHREAERRELARELHDEFGQSATAIRSLAKSLEQRLADDPAGREAAALIGTEAARLYDGMHGLIPRLTPLALDSLGLADALAELVNGARLRASGVTITLTTDALGPDLEPAASLAAYRVVQEALNNALKHSGARKVEIDVRRLDGPDGVAQLQARVRDDGRGLPEEWPGAGHYGLLGLRERASALGGWCNAGARPEGGTQVLALLPLPPAGARDETREDR